jgi:shikimate kinase / 3-dehydroquinate synthase
VALVLIGFMGAGKSTLAGRLARLRGAHAIDSDVVLTERFGHSVAREFELHGEQAFRAAEEEVMCGVLESAGPREVIALGGGSVLSRRIRDALSGHLVALLDVDVQLAWERVHESDDGSERPLARDRDAFGALYVERRGLYEDVADMWLLWAESDSGAYPVFMGRGLLTDGRLAAVWPLDLATSRPFCVTDTTVAGLYGDRLDALGDSGGTGASIAIEPGESHKTLASAERVWRELAQRGMTRTDHVVALGGGVVGDLAGFCAATYQRGVPVVHVPTTLVAQVDSAYGGKTGVDLPDAKNYVGVYHQPAGVLVDPDTLATLPAPELAAGWVEVLKTALIAGGALWERVSASPGCEVDERTIRDCARTKLEVVRADERDAGRRQVLNLGHTVGHALETVTGYTRYRHGEAVGLGLLAALALSGAQDLREQVRELLLARDLPVTLDGGGVGVEEIVAATARDKKRLGAGGVPFVLLSVPGEPRIGCEVSEKELRAAVQELFL